VIDVVWGEEGNIVQTIDENGNQEIKRNHFGKKSCE